MTLGFLVSSLSSNFKWSSELPGLDGWAAASAALPWVAAGAALPCAMPRITPSSTAKGASLASASLRTAHSGTAAPPCSLAVVHGNQ